MAAIPRLRQKTGAGELYVTWSQCTWFQCTWFQWTWFRLEHNGFSLKGCLQDLL